jgi:fibronectin type 3 domain-containing protein
MRRLAAGLLLSAALLFNGCGYVGDPLPPALNIPEKISDLRAVQRGDQLLIDFTIPKLTTEGLPIRKLGGVELQVGSTPVAVDATEGSVQTTVPAREWYGKEVIVRVRLLNSKGRPSDWSNEVAVAMAQPLAMPPDLRASPHPKGISVLWKAPGAGKLQYRVFRRAADEKEPLMIATVDRPEYIDAAVTADKRYEYSVQAFLANAESDVTPPVGVVSKDVFAPAAPSGLTAVASLSTIELGWERNPETDLGHYRVYRAEAEGPFIVAGEKVEEPAFSDKQITSGKVYRYAVSAVDQAGNEGERTAPVQAQAP